jgi:transposase InsO family protein
MRLTPKITRFCATVNTWREDYNHTRPHGSLGRLTPSEYADRGQKTDPEPPSL